jgi:hypothetical protein
MYTCRECERPINQATEICPYCGADLTVPALPEEEPAKKPSLAKTLLRWGVLIVALWAFLWFVLPEKKGDTAARSETVAIEALQETRVALAEYADARRGGYPTSLEAVANRVRSVAQRAQREGYRLEYLLGPVDTNGQIQTYALLARPGNYGYRNFCTDQTGVICSTSEDRAATVNDPPILK